VLITHDEKDFSGNVAETIDHQGIVIYTDANFLRDEPETAVRTLERVLDHVRRTGERDRLARRVAVAVIGPLSVLRHVHPQVGLLIGCLGIHCHREKRSSPSPSNAPTGDMREQAAVWLDYASADLAAAKRLVETHGTIAAYHAHQAAEKGLKALQIDREGDHERTHDLVRLYHDLDVPEEYRSVLEDLNPADTAARYPDAPDVELERPDETLDAVEELLTWIRRRSNE